MNPKPNPAAKQNAIPETAMSFSLNGEKVVTKFRHPPEAWYPHTVRLPHWLTQNNVPDREELERKLLNHPEGGHGIGDEDEPGDIGAHDVISGLTEFFCNGPTAFVDGGHDFGEPLLGEFESP